MAKSFRPFSIVFDQNGRGGVSYQTVQDFAGKSKVNNYFNAYEIVIGDVVNYEKSEYTYSGNSKLSATEKYIAASKFISAYDISFDSPLITYISNTKFGGFANQSTTTAGYVSTGGSFYLGSLNPTEIDITTRTRTYKSTLLVVTRNSAISTNIISTRLSSYTFGSIDGLGFVSFAPNPPENIQLFNITEQASVKNTETFVSSSDNKYYTPYQIIFEAENNKFTNPYNLSTSSKSPSYTKSYSSNGRNVISAYDIAFDENPISYISELKTSSLSIIASTESYATSGGFSTTSGAAEVYGTNPPENIQLFQISGSITEKSIESWNGTETINIIGAATVKAPNRYIGSSPTDYFTASTIVFANEENLSNNNVEVATGASYQFVRSGVSGTGTFTASFTNLNGSTASVYFVPILVTILMDANALASRMLRYQGKSPTTPFGAFDIIFEQIEANAPPTTQKFTSSSSISETNSYNGLISFNEFTVNGLVTRTRSFSEQGAGGFSTTSGAAQVYGPNPPENIQLFSFSGTLSESQTDITSGSGTVSISGTQPQISVYRHRGASPISYYTAQQIIFAEGEVFYSTEFKYTGTASYNKLSAGYSASGTFSTASGLAEASIVNPPENIQLFQISGGASLPPATFSFNATAGAINISGTYSNIKSTESWVGSSRFVYYEPYQIVFGEGELYYSAEFKVSSASSIRNVEVPVTSGTFTVASGAAEVYSPQTPENIQLFSFTGTCVEVYSPQTPENIQLFTIDNISSSSSTRVYTGTSPIAYYNPQQIVFAEGEVFYPTTLQLTGVAAKSTTPRGYNGTGTFSTASGLAEVFGTNPPENTQLFAISGSLVERNTEFYNGVETINITGAAAQARLYPNYVGSSPFAYYTAQQIVFAEGEVFYPTTLQLTGVAAKSTTPRGYNGTGTFSNTSGAAEAFGANTPENIQLFQISGGANLPAAQFSFVSTAGNITVTGTYSNIKSTESWIGSSRFVYYEPYQIVFGEGELYYSAEFKVSNASIVRNVEVPVTSGTFSVASGAAEVYSPQTPENIQLFSFTGTCAEVYSPQTPENIQLFTIAGGYSDIKSIDAWVGSSPIAYYNPQQIVFADGESFYPTTLQLSGIAKHIYLKPPYSGDGSIFTASGAAEAFSTNPPENIQLFQISGGASLPPATFSYNAVAGAINITGTYSEFKNVDAWVGTPRITYYEPYQIVFGEGELFYTTEFKLSNASVVKSIESFAGTGTFSTASGLAEVFGANSPENIQLFSVTGTLIEKSTDAWVGAETINITGAAAQARLYPNYVGTSPIAYYNPQQIVFAEGESYYPTTLQLTGVAAKSTTPRGYNGTGTLSSTGGLAEVFGANPPENIQLFQISGGANLPAAQFSYVAVPGSEFTIGGGRITKEIYIFNGKSAVTYYSPEQIVFGDGEVFYTNEFRYSGLNTKYTTAPRYSASGTFSVASGAAEVYSPQTPENIQLFSLSGTCVEVFAPQPPENIQLFAITGGYSDIKSTESWVGTPRITYYEPYQIVFGEGELFYTSEFRVSNASVVKSIESFNGTGTFSNTSGAAEAFSTNPPENIQLFQISGGASLPPATFSFNAVAGAINITGTASQSRLYPNYVGFSPIAYYSPEQIVFAEGESFYPTSPRITGVADKAYIRPPYIATGSLFTASGLSEVFATNPPENTQLFAIADTAVEKNTDVWSTATGGITLTGAENAPKVFKHTGYSSIAYYSPEQIVFGEGESFYPVEFKVTNTARYTELNAYSASGTFAVASGAAEVYSPQTPENIQLFSLSGTCAEVFAPQPPENIQLFDITGGYTNLKSIDAWVGTPRITYYEPYQIVFGEGELFYTTEFKLSNASVVKSIEAFTGTGTFSNTSGAAESSVVNPPENIQLFQISGGASLPPATFSFNAVAGAINITGGYTNLKSVDAWVGTPRITYYEPYEIVFGEGELFYTTEFKLSNASNIKSVEVFTGTGTFSNTSGAAEVFGANTPENIQLFSITGAYSNLQSVDAWNGTGNINITGAASQSRLYPNYIGSSPIAYYSPEQIVFAEGESFYPTTLQLTGVAAKSTTPRGYNGTGTFSSTGGLAEVFGTNPPENTQLFAITGTLVERNSESWNGTGTTNINGAASQSRLYPNYIGSSPIAYYSPEQIVFAEGESFYPTTLQLTGVAAKSTTPRGYNGTGTFSSTGGLAEVFGANPPENIQLFDFDNQFSTYIVKSTDAWNGTGNATISGVGQTPRTKVYTGASPIAYYSPEQIVFAEGELFYPTEYKFTGTAAYAKPVFVYTGAGTILSPITGAAQAFGANTPENVQLFSITGTSTVKLRDWIYISPPVLIDPNDIVFDNHIYDYDRINIGYRTWNSTTNTYDTNVTVNASRSYSGTGQFSTFSGLVESFSANTPENIQLFNITGNASVPVNARIIGSGQFSATSGAAESYSAQTPENIQLFSITDSATYRNVEVYVGTSTIEITGAYSNLQSVDAWSGSGLIYLTSDEIFDTFAYSYSGQVTPILAGFAGTASVTFNPPENTQLFDITISSSERRTTGVYTGTGTILSPITGLAEVFVANPPENTQLFSITGNATVPLNQLIIGSGSLYVTSGASQSTGSNPPENIQLFNITGTLSESQTDIASGSGTTTISGTATEKNTESYVGTGTFSVVSGASQSTGSNPPENTQLFDITVSSQIRTTVGVYNATVSYEFTGGYTNLQSVDVWSGSGNININANASYRFETGIYTGSAQFNISGAASQIFGANPPENTQLFAISGTLIESQTDAISGTGTFSVVSGASQSTGSNPPENIQLFSVTGAYSDLKSVDAWVGSGTTTVSGGYTNLKSTDAYNGSGTISITGAATESQTDITSGAGSLFTASGASQSTGSNPPENIQLFSVTGAYSDLKSVDAWVGTETINISGTAVVRIPAVLFGSGTATISGSLIEKSTDVEIGSGSLFTVGGHTEIFGANPPENIQLFNITGAYSDLKSVDAWVGSGTFTALSGAAESYSAQTPENIQLVDISISSVEKVNYSVVSTGSLFTEITSTASVTFNPPENTQLFSVTGAYSDLKSVDAWSGSGTFTALSGAAESVGANPPENTMLFSASGNVYQTSTSNNIGFATAEITGSASDIKYQPSYAGSGTTNINGNATVAFVSNNIQSGSLFAASGLSEAFGANPPENIQLFTISGTYSNLQSVIVEIGSGTFSNIDGAVEAFGANPPENIQLFEISGQGEEKFETSSYRGMGTIDVTPNAEHSFSKIAEFDAGTFDVNATSDKSISYGNFTGSGSLFGLVSYEENVTFVPAVGIVIPEQTPLGSTTLFTLYGSADVQFGAHTYQGNGIININVNAVVRTQLPERVFVTIV